jgi:hypothetical protein
VTAGDQQEPLTRKAYQDVPSVCSVGLLPPQSFAEKLSGSTVGLSNPCRVDAQRRRSAAAMAESAGDRAEVDAGREQLGGRVVTQRAEVAADAQLGAHPRVAV